MITLSRRALMAGLLSTAISEAGHAVEVAPRLLSSSKEKRVRAKVERFRSQYNVPGLSVAFSRRGKFAYVAAFGEADRSTHETLSPEHQFRIASVSKPITASVVMLLAERKMLDLQQNVFGNDGIFEGRYSLPDGTADWLKQITIDHLLTHTSGAWTNDNRDPMFMHVADDHASLIQRTLLAAELTQPPGKAYAYSNFGYCLLGRVIEQVTGESYETFVQKAVLQPCGAGGMLIAGNALGDRQPKEVVYEGDYAYAMNVHRMDSHGGWIGSASDLVNFALRVDGYDSVADLLSRKSISLMAKPTRVYSGYGRGWALNPRHRNRWHTGRISGTTGILVRVDGDACFAGLVNTSAPGLDEALDTLMWDIYAEVFG